VPRSLGDAWISIHPDTGGFRALLDAQIKAATAALRPAVSVRLTASTSGALASVVNLQARMTALSKTLASVKIGADDKAALATVAGLQAKLLALVKTVSAIALDADTSKIDAQIAALQAKLAALNLQASNEKLDFDDAAAVAKIAALKLQAATLGQRLASLAKLGITSGTLWDAWSKRLDAINAQVVVLESNLENLRIGANTAAVTAAIASVTAEIDVLKAKAADIALGVDVGGIAKANVALLGLEAAAKDVGLSARQGSAGMALLNRAAAGGWGIFGVLGTRIALFGGLLRGVLPQMLLEVSVWHLLADVAVEVIAVWGGAAIALGAFAIAGSDAAKEVYQRMKDIHTAADATGQAIPPLTGALEQLHNAVRPQVYQLFGDALQIAGTHTGEFAQLAKGAGTVLDQLGGRLTAAITHGNAFNIFTQHAVSNLAGLGTSFGNVFGAIGNVISVVPGYAEVLLGLGVKITGLIESFTRGLEPVLKWGLAIHGAFIYIGLAITATVALAGPVGRLAVAFFGAAVNAGIYATGLAAVARTSGLAAAGLQLVSDVPIAVWVGLALAAIAGLVLAFKSASSATQGFDNSIQKTISNSNLAQTQGALSAAIGETAKQMGIAEIAVQGYQRQINNLNPVAAIANARGANDQLNTSLANAKGLVQGYGGELSYLTGQQKTYGDHLKQVAGITGSTASAIRILNAAGISQNQMLDQNTQDWYATTAQILGTIAAYKAMSGTAGQLNNDLDVLGRTATDQYVAVQNLNQAWGSFISDVTGTQTAFDTVALGVATLDANFQKAGGTGGVLTSRLGRLTLTGKLTGATMDGLSQASLDLNQAFSTQVSNTDKLFASWRTAGIANDVFIGGVKDAIAPLVKYAAGSQEATAQLVGLAQEAGYHGPVSMKALIQWLGNVSNATQKVKDITNQATTQEALLTGAMESQGTYIANTLIGDINNAILKYDGVQKAATDYGNAIAKSGTQSDAAATARKRLIQDLIASGTAAHDSTTQIAAMIAKILQIPLKKAIAIVLQMEGQGQIKITGTGLNTRTINTTTGTVYTLGGHTGGPPIAARGAYITSGTTPTADDVLVLASKGELVVPANIVKAGGVDHLRGMIPGFAAGGVTGTDNFVRATVNPSAVAIGTAEATFGADAAQAFAAAAIAAAQRQAAITAAAGAGGGGVSLAGLSASSGYQAFQVVAAKMGWDATQLAAWVNVEMREAGFCVTINHMILTKRGWLKHDEVIPGDETIGYNPETGKSEWTRVTHVWHYEDEPVVTYGNKYWQATFTPGHRWLTETRLRSRAHAGLSICPVCGFTGKTERLGIRNHMVRSHGWEKATPRAEEAWQQPELTPWNEFTGKERIILSCPADTGTGLPITDQEAALLAWIAGDGCVMENKPVRRKAPPVPPANWQEHTENAPFGLRRDGTPKKSAGGRPYKDLMRTSVPGTSGLSVTIAQSKSEHFAAIEEALAGIPGVGRYTQDRRGKSTGLSHGGTTRLVTHSWRLPAAYARDLLARAGHPKKDAFEQVTRMSASQRRAWLGAMIRAEGTVHVPEPGKPKDGRKTVIYQFEGRVADAIELAVYLEGYRPGRSVSQAGEVAIRPAVPHVGGPQRLSHSQDAGTAAVWCCTTELGSWTTRNESGMFLTGNSLTATNPTSGAYGMAQFILGPSEYAQYGGNATTYIGQAVAMANYIKSRYGTPAAAWSHEQALNWYDRGGVLPAGGIGVNTSGHAEMVTPASGPASLAATNMRLDKLCHQMDQLIRVTATTGPAVGHALAGTARRAASRGYYSG
jgi:hypothetical protein